MVGGEDGEEVAIGQSPVECRGIDSSGAEAGTRGNFVAIDIEDV
jgi:hypothetical protein